MVVISSRLWLGIYVNGVLSCFMSVIGVQLKADPLSIVRRGMGRRFLIPIPIHFVHDCLNKKLIIEDGK